MQAYILIGRSCHSRRYFHFTDAQTETQGNGLTSHRLHGRQLVESEELALTHTFSTTGIVSNHFR